MFNLGRTWESTGAMAMAPVAVFEAATAAAEAAIVVVATEVANERTGQGLIYRLWFCVVLLKLVIFLIPWGGCL
jgi:hypothetical protein